MKLVLASEAMECCAKAMEDEVARELGEDAWNDVRAIYQAAATIEAGWIAARSNYAGSASPTMPVPTWLVELVGFV